MLRMRVLLNSVWVVLIVVIFFSAAGHANAANPVTRGGSTTLVWSITNATSCTGDPGGYPISTDGLYDYWKGPHTGLVSGQTYTTTFSGIIGDSTKSFPQTYTFSCSFTDPTTGAITSGSATLTVNGCATGTTWNSTSNRCVANPAPVNGSCGTANGKTYPYGSTGYSPDTQCSNGSPSSTTFPSAGGSTSWTCSGTNGGSVSGTCSASQSAAASCPATTINNCGLPTTASGGSAGSCGTGYSGTCSYTCNNGTWSRNSNSCTPIVYSCTGLPAHANAFAAPDNAPPADTAYTYSSGTTANPPYCQFNCDTDYTWNSTTQVCEPNVYSCTGLPAHANAFAAPDNAPPATTAYTFSTGTTANPPYCQFNCNTGYTWNSTTQACEAVVLNISGTCSVSPSSGTTNTTFTWALNNDVSGGAGPGTYTYAWGGGPGPSDNLSGSGTSVTKVYKTSGAKLGWVVISSPGSPSQEIHCDNNVTGGTTITVDSLPDLTASAVLPVTAVTNTPTLFSATISNANASTRGGFWSFFQRADAYNAATDVATNVQDLVPAYRQTSTLVAGGTATASVTYAPPSSGTMYIRVCADKDSRGDAGTISESNDDNNCGSWTEVTVSNPISGTCSVSPSSGTTNTTFTWTLNNDVSGGAGPGTYTYAWGGGPGPSDTLAGSGTSATKIYTASGDKLGWVVVSSGGSPSQTIHCTNTVTGGTTITVTPIPTATLSCGQTKGGSTPQCTIYAGQSTKLFWTSTNATTCTAAGGFSTGGATANNSGVSVGPLTSSRNYQIYCDGSGNRGYSNTVAVTVLSPNVRVTVNPPRVTKGNPVIVTVTADNVDSCTITRNGASWKTFTGDPFGTVTQPFTDPKITAQTTYEISCPNAASSITVTAKQIVNIEALFQEF